MKTVSPNGTHAATSGAQHLDGSANGAPQINGIDSIPVNLPPDNLAAQLWRGGAPNEWAFFAHLCGSISDETAETLDRLRVTDFKHDTSALIYEAAAALRGRGVPLFPEHLAKECTRRGGECDRHSDTVKWENAHDACDALNTSQAPKGNPDRLAVQLAEKIAPKQRWEFTPLSSLRARPRPLWLIQDILIEATAAVLSGDSQSFKTFSALDMALSIATGTPWHGKAVKRGAVVYIAAEGGWTLRDRLEAWETARGVTVSDADFHLLEIPVSFGDPATVAQFAHFIKAHKPAFVVIDTLSACAEGLKENASEDMATFVRHMKAVATETGATSAVIHHNNKGGDLRGAVSLKNDADTHLTFARSTDEDDLITVVSCSKHRGTKFADFSLQGEQIELIEPDEYGRPVTSLVFSTCEMPEGQAPTKNANSIRADATRARMLEVFDGIAARFDGVKTGTWQAEAAALPKPLSVSKATFHRHLKALVEAREIENNGDVWHRIKCVVSEVSEVSNGTCKTESEVSSPSCLISPTHPLGVGLVRQSERHAPKLRKGHSKNSPDAEPYGVTDYATADEVII